MNKKIFIFGFVFLFLISSFTIAVPPSDTTNNFYIQEGGPINIEYQNRLYYTEGEEIFNFHVFDGVTGLILNESEVSCSAKIYTAKRKEIYYEEELTTTDGSINTFHARTNISKGKYEGIAYCYNSTEGGYVSAQIIVNPYGEEPKESSFNMISAIFIIQFITLIYLLIRYLAILLMNESNWVNTITYMVASSISFMTGLILSMHRVEILAYSSLLGVERVLFMLHFMLFMAGIIIMFKNLKPKYKGSYKPPKSG